MLKRNAMYIDGRHANARNDLDLVYRASLPPTSQPNVLLNAFIFLFPNQIPNYIIFAILIRLLLDDAGLELELELGSGFAGAGRTSGPSCTRLTGLCGGG